MDSERPRAKLVAGAAFRGILGGLFLGVVFFGGYYYRGLSLDNRQETSPERYALLSEAELALQDHFLYELPDDEIMVQGAVRGLVDSLEDPYTRYSEPQIAEIDSTNLAGEFGGIGIEVGLNDAGHVVVSRVYRDNPAYDAGVQEGDVIIAIDDIPIPVDLSDLNGVVADIRGDVGEPISLTLSRDGETLSVTIIRATVLIPSSFWRVLEEDSRIGYIQIVRFTDRTHEEVLLALEELRNAEISGLILDLRDNGGGLVDSAVEVTGEFVDGGIILFEDRRATGEETVYASQGGRALDLPLVVLVNAHSASASEIVAGALQDRDRATLIGQPTTGKGSVQVIIALSDGSSIRITSAQWFTPDRNRIEGTGLQPDILVDVEASGDTADPFIDSAIQILEIGFSN